MKVRMLDKNVAIENFDKIKKQAGSLLHIPTNGEGTGKVKYVSAAVSSIRIGDIVCFGAARQRARLGGDDLEIMDIDNIYAVLEGEATNVEEEAATK